MNQHTLELRELMIFLAAAGLVVPLLRRIRISPIFGFLLVGFAIGPHGLVGFSSHFPWLKYALITDIENVRLLAELGVVFLLFMIGLELSLGRLWEMRRRVFGLGGFQILITGICIALAVWVFENTLVVSAVLGASFALSSTAIVMQILTENQRLGTPTGRASFAILLCQDLAVLPILFLVGTFAAQSDTAILPAFGLSMLKALVAIAMILALGRWLVQPLFRFVGMTASREMFLALVLLVILGTAVATQEFGLSMALGAFLAGLLLAETEYRYEIEVDIEPFKGLLLGLFFMSIGMGIDIVQVMAAPFLLLASIVGLYLIKSPIIYILSRVFGETRPVAMETSLLLGQGGEFAFVIVAMAQGLKIIPDTTAQFVLAVAGLAMITTPVIAHLARSLAQRVEAGQATNLQYDDEMPTGLAGHVVIIGYGRIGKLLSSLLDSQRLPYVGLDIDPDLVDHYRSSGAAIYYGDAKKPDILRRFNVDQAAALVVTMDSPKIVEQVVAMARRNWPDLTIYARAHDRDHANRLLSLGANYSIPEAVELSLQLGEVVLTGLGVPDNAARRIIETCRQREEERTTD